MSCAVLSVLEYLKSYPTISHTRPSPKHVLTAMDGLHGFPSVLALPEKDGCRRSMKLLRDRDIYNILSRAGASNCGTAPQLQYLTVLHSTVLYCTVPYVYCTSQSICRAAVCRFIAGKSFRRCMPDQDQARPGQDRANWCITLQLVCVENDVQEISMRWAMGDRMEGRREAWGMGWMRR